MRTERFAVPLLAAVLLGTPISASAAGEAPRTGSSAVRPGGINVEPSMRPWRFHGANPDGWWCRRRACHGVADGIAFVNREVPLVAALGVSILRLEFPWPLIEPRRGAFDWRRSDAIVRKVRRARLQVLPVLVYTPGWVAKGRSDPPSARHFSKFVRAFATRYRRAIHYYELWNEPDLARYWTGRQSQYVHDVLIPGYRAVKARDPGAKVVVGPSSANADWLNGLYRLGGGRFFDAVAFHDYSGDWRHMVESGHVVRRVLEAHGQGAKPVWLGEYGVQEAELADVRQQALMRSALTESAPFGLAAWYSLRDDFPMTCCPPRRVKSEHYGLLTHRYVKKQGYDTMRQLLAGRRWRP
jgi:hypothetical protein